MSPYEILAIAALVCAAGFAYRLYRKDTRGNGPGATQRPANQGEPMFSRPRSKPGSGSKDQS
jgi:hypothetical protein